jgi:hypothetical protein
MGDPLFCRAWNIQVLTSPDNAGQQTLLEVSSRHPRFSSQLTLWGRLHAVRSEEADRGRELHPGPDTERAIVILETQRAMAMLSHRAPSAALPAPCALRCGMRQWSRAICCRARATSSGNASTTQFRNMQATALSGLMPRPVVEASSLTAWRLSHWVKVAPIVVRLHCSFRSSPRIEKARQWRASCVVCKVLRSVNLEVHFYADLYRFHHEIICERERLGVADSRAYA